jgi:hypothetical protein
MTVEAVMAEAVADILIDRRTNESTTGRKKAPGNALSEAVWQIA